MSPLQTPHASLILPVSRRRNVPFCPGRCALLLSFLAWITLALPGHSSAAPKTTSSCDISMRLDALTVSSNALKIGFPAFLPNSQNPTIYFRKKADVETSLNNSCYICHESGRRTTSDTWIYDPETGRGPTNILWSGQLTYHAETNGQTTVDCASTRIGPDVWDNPFCEFSDPSPGEIVVSNRTASAYRLVLQRKERELIQTQRGSSVREVSESSSLNLTLAEPYSLADFLSGVESGLSAAAWPDWSSASHNGWAERGGRQVLRQVAADRAELNASLAKLKYRIAVRGPRDQSHTVAWIERFTPNGGGEIVDTPFTEEVTFTGQEQFLSATGGDQGKTVDPPSQIGTIDVILVGNWSCDSQNCRPGKGQVSTGSIDVRISLGKMLSGETAGFLSLHEEQPAVDLANPRRLQVFGHREVELIKEHGMLRQIKAPEALVLVVPDPAGYEIRLHSGSAGQDANGYYLPAGQPNVTWRIESPSSDPHRLRVVQSASGEPLISEFQWSVNDQAWALVIEGLRKEVRSVNQTGGLRTEAFTIREMDDRLVFRQARIWRQYEGPLGELLVHEQIGSIDNPLATSWTYFDNPLDGAAYGKVRSVARTEGGQEEYEYEAAGRLSIVRAPFGNTPGGRVTQFRYSPIDPLDAGTLAASTPRTTIESVLGREIRRGYVSVRATETLSIECQSPGALWDDPSNLITTNRTGLLPGEDGSVETMLYPDGTVQVSRNPIERPGVPRVQSVATGAPNAQHTDVVDGTRSVTSWDAAGRLASQETFDIRTGAPLSRETHHYPDPFGPADQISFLDGTFVLADYDCCNLASTVDQNGTITTFTYDRLDRLASTTRNGISLIYSYDAAGNLILLRRQGSDGSIRLLQEAAFDLAGRQISSIDEERNATYFYAGQSPGGLGRIKVTTLPDGGTVTEVFSLDGSLSETRGSATKPARYEQAVVEDAGIPRLTVRETKLAADSTDLAEWTATYFDMLGRPYKIMRSDGASQEVFYNARGQLWKQRDFDGRVTLSGYNPKGEAEFTAIDTDASDSIDLAGTDRVTRTVVDVSDGRRRSRTYLWPIVGRNEPVLAASLETSLDGREQSRTVFESTTWTRTELLGGGVVRVTETAPDNSRKVLDSWDGRLIAFTHTGAKGEALARTNYSYDAHGRLSVATDARTGASRRFAYDGSDQLAQVTTPAWGELPGGNVLLERDGLGRVTRQILASGARLTNDYTAAGQVARTFGAHTFPVEYSYDSQGRLTNMTTWSGAGPVERFWTYNSRNGWLAETSYPGSGSAGFSYTAAGKLSERRTGRGINVSYRYNSARDLEAIGYSDSTDAVRLLDLDRLGRPGRVLVGTNEARLFHHPDGRLISESFGDLVVTNALDALLRPGTVSIRSPALGQTLQEEVLAYDGASRIKGVRAGPLSVEYAYFNNSSVVRDVAFRYNGTLRLYSTRQLDAEGRVTTVGLSPAAGSALSFRFAYDQDNRRLNTAEADGSFWSYQYDPVGQLVSGKKFWTDNTLVAGQQFEYGFDGIGNRLATRRGGDRDGNGLRFAAYQLLSPNQYSARAVPGVIDILGQAPPAAVVSVHAQGVARASNYFHAALSLNTSTGATYLIVTNRAVFANASRTEVGGVFLPKPRQEFGYDADGNLTNDGRWTFSWNAENRLVGLEAASDVPAPLRQKLAFSYDYRGRRVTKTISNWNASATSYELGGQQRFVYDGWRLVAELNETNGLLHTYVWGADLSGTRDGAAGVGGLLAMFDHSGLTPSAYYYAHDSIGNVRALIRADDGSIAASYEYGPFGELLRATGPMARANPFRFATRYQDVETELIYFGLRWYQPDLGRWLSRDPVGEAGGLNLYVFVGNDPVNYWDALGLEKGAELLRNPRSLPQREVVPGVTVRRFVGPGGHQWFGLETQDGLVHAGVNKGTGKGRWVDETANRSRDLLENPDRYYEWEVAKRILGWARDGTSCQCLTVAHIRKCIGKTILFEASAGTPRPFNLVCNNCRDNSERVLRNCCAEKGRLVHNPDGSNFLERFVLDWFVGPGVYAPMASGGN